MDLAANDSYSYLAVGITVIISLIITSSILILNKLLGLKPREITKIKGDTYECGVPYEGDARQQFSVRYYLVGIIFLIFDVEVIFMYPWTMVFKHSSNAAVLALELAFFILPLLGAYIYLRFCRAFDWD